ncbi:MAG: hypothetical protein AAF351_09085 [Pseudomonadota bacterium]
MDIKEYRVTKYDPSRRDADGVYWDDDWTLFSDIGKSDRNGVLTLEEYERVETAYVQTAIDFIVESGGSSLSAVRISTVGNPKLDFDPTLPLEGPLLSNVIRNRLREKYFLHFEDQAGRFLHFGWDYYMFVGVPVACPLAEAAAHQRGLFVEEFESPFHEPDDADWT